MPLVPFARRVLVVLPLPYFIVAFTTTYRGGGDPFEFAFVALSRLSTNDSEGNTARSIPLLLVEVSVLPGISGILLVAV